MEHRVEHGEEGVARAGREGIEGVHDRVDEAVEGAADAQVEDALPHDLGVGVEEPDDLRGEELYREDARRRDEQGEAQAAQACGVGVPTLRDVAAELMKPGRDPRDELPKPILRTDVLEMKDLKPGMELTGTVRNVIDFGVFVDIGVHQDGLVHISQLGAPRRVRHPSEVCAVGDIVTVWVLEVDEKKKRISLTMKKPQ